MLTQHIQQPSPHCKPLSVMFPHASVQETPDGPASDGNFLMLYNSLVTELKTNPSATETDAVISTNKQILKSEN